MRIGTILEAERVEGTDKLIKCIIDLGDKNNEGEAELRTVVSGLAESIAPEELVGKQCPYVCNLAPRTICGVESQGMILAMGTDDGFALLHPNKEVVSGTSIG
jgi:methionine--tRNA ligase beta chain